MFTRFIGDVHGKVGGLRDILASLPADVSGAVQVGDMGVGFPPNNEKHHQNWNNLLEEFNCKFIRGNHDNPTRCKTMSAWIPDGTVVDDAMYVGGAWSIDSRWRIEGSDWWSDEQVSQFNFAQIMDVYDLVKPKIMVTHDCPEKVSEELFISTGKAIGDKRYTTLTGSALQEMFNSHSPDIWIFGHWHNDVDVVINGTRFICLAELSHIDINMNTLETRKS